LAFKNLITIYESESTRVYINQCHNPRKKTQLYSVRKDSSTGLAEHLGLIKWNGAWRQYCFFPDLETLWSSGCLQGIIDFLTEINALKRFKK
jgi:hypothetical protein